MRKKHIIINSLILFFSLVIFLLSSMYVIYYLNESSTKSLIKNYLSVTESAYDGSNMIYVGNSIHESNKNVRITFISPAGVVLYDTDVNSVENHLNRPEIEKLGVVIQRYSKTTNETMYYVATFDEKHNVYIRASLPKVFVLDVVKVYAYFGIAGCVSISLISFWFIYYSSKKITKPLKEEIESLSQVTNTTLTYKGDDLLELSHQIEQVRRIINSNIDALKLESSKLNYIIDNMNNGLIIIRGDGKIDLVNNLALKILKREREELENKSYLECFVNARINNLIEKAMREKVESETMYENNDRYYAIYISSLYANFTMRNTSGVSIFIHDITEQKKLETVKLDFFSNASHELKSPLTSIIGYQQMIHEGILTDESDLKEATEKTIKEATRMNNIIIEMLDLSKLEMDTVVERNKLSLVSNVDSVLESFDYQINSKNITLIKNYDDFMVTINNDELYHIVRNLIDNAVKYNKVDGSITVTVDSKTKTLSIKDTGIGISNENKERIFERFYRVDKAKSKELGGTGLGLAIVKHICMNNGFKIEVKSKLGEGTEFIIYFK